MRLLITQEFLDSALRELDGTGIEVQVRDDPEPLAPQELAAALAGYDGVVCMLTDRMDDALMAANPQLRVIANTAAGYDNIEVAAAAARGIVVTNTPDVLTESTADLALALLLAAARRIPEGDAFAREGRYEHWQLRQPQIGLDVFGQTLGIFGLGKIGRAVAARARGGFAMDILYHSRTRLPAGTEEALGLSYVGFDELLEASDFVSIHAPLTDETHHRFNQAAFARMKPTAILINTGRGPIVDEEALADALATGQIAGAGIDVYEHEPAMHPRLVEQRARVVLLPHLGSATVGTRTRMAHLAVINAREVLLGRQPPNPVPGPTAGRDADDVDDDGRVPEF